jgi:hypothetical protein
MATASIARDPGGWFFWLAWFLGSILAWFASPFLAFLPIAAVWGDPSTALSEGSPAYTAALTMLFTVIGIGLGTAQWLVLRRRIDRAGWWILASGLGFAVIVPLNNALLGMMSEAANAAVTGAVAGAVAGLLQYLILQQRVGRAWLWVAIISAGMVVAGGGAAVVRAITGLDEGTSETVGIAAMAALTGAAMVWLLRQSVSET